MKIDANDILRTEGPNALRNAFDEAIAGAAKVATRDDLLLSAWLKRDIPERDHLLGDILCTTSRWLIFGETGVGKTLFAMDMLAAAAKGEGVFKLEGPRDV